MAFSPIILLLLYPLLLAALRHTHYVILQIYKQYMQTQLYYNSLLPSVVVIGMSFQSKLETLPAQYI